MAARGLVNLGNTCYLNATVQVLAHAQPLKSLFNDENASYKAHINYQTKISEGKVAESFGALITQMWVRNGNGSPRPITPSNFRGVIGKIDSRWRGIEQHDAHEFFQFLINSIHDDLNRVKERPTLPERDEAAFERLPEAEQARQVWEAESAISNSPVSDSFRGLFKSSVTCPECHKVSIKFDPFFDVAVPLPSKSFSSFSVTFISLVDSIEHKDLRFTMKSSHTIGDVKSEIAKALGIPDENKGTLVIAHVFEDEFVRFFMDDTESIQAISSNDEIYCYLTASDFKIPSLSAITLPVFQRVSGPILTEDRKRYITSSKAVSFPFLVTLPRHIKYGDLRDFISRQASKLVEISAAKNEGDLPPLILANSFGLSKICFPDRRPKPLLLSDSAMVSFTNSDALSIDWCPQGLSQERFSRKRPTSKIEIAPDGTDVATELSLEDCLRSFTEEEKLGADDHWYCPTCKDHRQATKKLEIWTLPEILVIQLKRFERSGFWAGKKITKTVRFPLNGLDTRDFMAPESRLQSPVLYDLNHVGALPIMGHYTAMVRGEDGKWYNYDDDDVDEVADESDIVSSRAYLLVYKRRV